MCLAFYEHECTNGRIHWSQGTQHDKQMRIKEIAAAHHIICPSDFFAKQSLRTSTSTRPLRGRSLGGARIAHRSRQILRANSTLMTVSGDFLQDCIMRMPTICRAQATDSMIKHKVAYYPSSIEPRPAAFSNSPEEHFVCTPDTPLLCACDDRASTHMDTQSIPDRPENRQGL